MASSPISTPRTVSPQDPSDTPPPVIALILVLLLVGAFGILIGSIFTAGVIYLLTR